MEAKEGEGSATLSTAYSGFIFVEKCLDGNISAASSAACSRHHHCCRCERLVHFLDPGGMTLFNSSSLNHPARVLWCRSCRQAERV